MNNTFISNKDNLCWSCLKLYSSKDINNITFNSLEYGGEFDGFETKLQLCNECFENTNPKWWDFELVTFETNTHDVFQMYKYEDEIIDFINSLSIPSQELFYNTCSSNNLKMLPQDWIDYNTNTLSLDKLNEYGLVAK